MNPDLQLGAVNRRAAEAPKEGLLLLDEATLLRARLEEAEEVLNAIRSGEVDAVVVQGPKGDQLFTLKGVDDPYRVLIEEMNQGAVTLGGNGEVLYCNRRFAALVKRTTDELIGIEFEALVAPSEREAFQFLLAISPSSSRELILTAPDGTAVPVQLALSRLPANSAAMVCLIATDISASKQVEAELKSREARLSEAQQSAQIGSWEWNVITEKISWSDELYRIYGLNRAEFIPTDKNIGDFIHPDDREWVLDQVHGARRAKGSFTHDHRIIRADSSEGAIHARGRMTLDEMGEAVKFVGTSQDITQRKRADAALEDANRQLREVSRQSGMAEVATSVLHNVGNVLNSVNISCSVVSDIVSKSRISGVAKTADLLRQHADDLCSFFSAGKAGQKLPDYLSKLARLLEEDQATILAELQSLTVNIGHIKDIVSLQQRHAKYVGGISETLQMEGLVEDAMRINERALARHGIEVIREYNGVPPAPMEKHKVLQILVNLIRNAKHALTAADRPDKQLVLRIEQKLGDVVVSVCDNGIGVEPGNLTRIFAHGFTTKTNGHGFGLHSGVLAAQEMGGSLTVASAGLGCGATFTLSLPAAVQTHI